jgi:hypothetical protein
LGILEIVWMHFAVWDGQEPLWFEYEISLIGSCVGNLVPRL